MVRTLAILVVVAALVGWGGSAFSVAADDDDGTVSGGDVSGPGAEFPVTPEMQKKLDLLALFEQAQDGRVPATTYQRAADSFFTERDVPQTARSVSAAAAPAGRRLEWKHMPQNKGHYCGPATGLMMVWMLKGPDRSAYDNSKFWQSLMANWRHMRTDIDGATRWANGTFQRGVNRWTGWSLYQPDDGPSGGAVASYLRFMIGANGMPIAGDTVEFAGRAHYNRHPQNQTIGHWITAFRYTENGDWSKWGDPSTSLWPGVRPAFGRWTRPFTNTFL